MAWPIILTFLLILVRNVLEEDRINIDVPTTEIIDITEREDTTETDSDESTYPPLKNPVYVTERPVDSEETTLSQSGTTFNGDSETVSRHKVNLIRNHQTNSLIIFFI